MNMNQIHTPRQIAERERQGETPQSMRSHERDESQERPLSDALNESLTRINEIRQRAGQGKPRPWQRGSVSQEPHYTYLPAHLLTQTADPLPDHVYIGRESQYLELEASPLANRPRRKGERPGDTLPEYRQWIWAKMKEGNEAVLGELRKINKTRVLMCHCRSCFQIEGAETYHIPRTCHASIVAAAAAWLEEQDRKDRFR